MPKLADFDCVQSPSAAAVLTDMKSALLPLDLTKFATDNILILVESNRWYADFVAILVETFKTLRITNYIVLCEDETCPHDANTVFIGRMDAAESDYSTWFQWFNMFRPLRALHFLQQGYDVVYTDPIVAWHRNVAKDAAAASADAALLFASEACVAESKLRRSHAGDDVSSSFFFAKAGAGAAELMKRWYVEIERLWSPPSCARPDDQFALNKILTEKCSPDLSGCKTAVLPTTVFAPGCLADAMSGAERKAIGALHMNLRQSKERKHVALTKWGRYDPTIPHQDEFAEQRPAECAPWGPRGAVTPLDVLFPAPQEIEWSGGCCVGLGPDVVIDAPADLAADVERLKAHLADCAPRWSKAIALKRLDVRLGAGFPAPAADESYRIRCAKRACTVGAQTVAGARYGLDTLVRALLGGVAAAAWETLSVADWPAFPHRGLMVDLGRRFVPLAVLKSLVDGMFLARLNVLHLHLNDFCRVAVQLPGFPELQGAAEGASAGDGVLTAEEVKELVHHSCSFDWGRRGT